LSAGQSRRILRAVLPVQMVRGLVVAVLFLGAPVARAECAKSTAMRPCQNGAEERARRYGRGALGPRHEARSPLLVTAGVGAAAVGAIGLVLAAFTWEPAHRELCRECGAARVLHYSGLVVGVVGAVGGTAMIYYGALDAPKPGPVITPPSPLSRGLTLRIRF
jgi:hypothetical protein